jgi:quinol monooxygenase YgiN
VSKIVVEARFTLNDPSRRSELIEATVEAQRSTRDDEPGCLAYCFAADPVHDDVIQVYELWESATALAAHFEHPNYWTMRKLLEGSGLISGASSTKHRIDASAPTYGPGFVATADFD